ncbi:Uncharacterised protein [uncultured archaeon]|nr:Uncharacterised protein [uncultured archaeon]
MKETNNLEKNKSRTVSYGYYFFGTKDTKTKTSLVQIFDDIVWRW